MSRKIPVEAEWLFITSKNKEMFISLIFCSYFLVFQRDGLCSMQRRWDSSHARSVFIIQHPSPGFRFFFYSLTGGCYPLKSTQTITTVVIFKQPGHSDRMLIYKKKYILFFQATLLFSGCIIYVGGPEKGMKLTCLQNLKKPME